MDGNVVDIRAKKKEIEKDIEGARDDMRAAFVAKAKDILKAVSDDIDRHDADGLIIITVNPHDSYVYLDLLPTLGIPPVVGALEIVKLSLYETLGGDD